LPWRLTSPEHIYETTQTPSQRERRGAIGFDDGVTEVFPNLGGGGFKIRRGWSKRGHEKGLSPIADIDRHLAPKRWLQGCLHLESVDSPEECIDDQGIMSPEYQGDQQSILRTVSIILLMIFIS
jgi:hypothetical protein